VVRLHHPPGNVIEAVLHLLSWYLLQVLLLRQHTSALHHESSVRVATLAVFMASKMVSSTTVEACTTLQLVARYVVAEEALREIAT
jgi:hypothetical protein